MASSSQSYPETPHTGGMEPSDKSLLSPEEDRSQSPSQCSICLGKFKDKSFTDSCFHTFCFSCLQEWSKVKRVCPLCKTSFSSVIHNIKSNEDYETFYLPALTNNPHEEDDEARRFRYASTLTQERRYLMRMRQFARDARRQERQRREENALSRRRLIYSAGLRVLHMGSNEYTLFHDISPQFFSANPAVTHRLVPWLNRELSVLFDNQEEHVTFMTHYILSLITNVDIQSEEFHVNLRPFLHDTVEHFVHEFASFARSPYDMETYDQMAQYDFSGGGVGRNRPRVNLPVRPPTQVDSDSDEHSVVLLSDHDSEPMVISDGNASDPDEGPGINQALPNMGFPGGQPPATFPVITIGSPNDNNYHPTLHNHESTNHNLVPLTNHGQLTHYPEPPREPILPPAEPVAPPLPPGPPASAPEPSIVPSKQPVVSSDVPATPTVEPVPPPSAKPDEPSLNPDQPGPSGIQAPATGEKVKIKEEPPDFHDSDHSDIEFVAFLKPSHMRTPERFMLSSESESEVLAQEEEKKKWQKEKKRRKRLREMMQEINTIEQNMITVDSDSGGRRSRSSSYDRSPPRRRRSRSREGRRRRSTSTRRRRSTSTDRSRDRGDSRRSPSKTKTTSWRDKFGYSERTPSPQKDSSGTSQRAKENSRKENQKAHRKEMDSVQDRREKSSRDRREKSVSKSRTSRREKSKSVDRRRLPRSRSRDRRVERSRSHSRDRKAKPSRSRSRDRRDKRSRSRSHDKRVKPSRSDSHERRAKLSPSRSRAKKGKSSRSRSRDRRAEPATSRDKRAKSRSRSHNGRDDASRSRSRERSCVKGTKQSQSHSRDKRAKSSRSRSNSREKRAQASPSRSRDHSPAKSRKKLSKKKRSRSREESSSSRRKDDGSRREKSRSADRSNSKPKKSKKQSRRSRSRSRGHKRSRKPCRRIRETLAVLIVDEHW